MSDAVPSTPHVLGRALKEMLAETSLDKVTVVAPVSYTHLRAHET